MSMSLENAQAILDTLVQAQINDPLGALGSVTIGGRTVQYKSAEELIKSINYWSGLVTQLKRQADGNARHGRSAAVFTRR